MILILISAKEKTGAHRAGQQAAPTNSQTKAKQHLSLSVALRVEARRTKHHKQGRGQAHLYTTKNKIMIKYEKINKYRINKK
jgi:hypothetical protein